MKKRNNKFLRDDEEDDEDTVIHGTQKEIYKFNPSHLKLFSKNSTPIPKNKVENPLSVWKTMNRSVNRRKEKISNREKKLEDTEAKMEEDSSMMMDDLEKTFQMELEEEKKHEEEIGREDLREYEKYNELILPKEELKEEITEEFTDSKEILPHRKVLSLIVQKVFNTNSFIKDQQLINHTEIIHQSEERVNKK